MAYENFIPTVWAEAINRELEKALVYAEGCNRQYDGEVKAMGDTVRILGVGRPTITTTTDKAITLSAPETVSYTHLDVYKRQPWACGTRRESYPKKVKLQLKKCVMILNR